jgi:hypothetical protein
MALRWQQPVPCMLWLYRTLYHRQLWVYRMLRHWQLLHFSLLWTTASAARKCCHAKQPKP